MTSTTSKLITERLVSLHVELANKEHKYIYITLHMIQKKSQWIVLVHAENENLYFCFVNAEFLRVV